jgi:hypothetical protein
MSESDNDSGPCDMPTVGDEDDFISRLFRMLPSRWFPFTQGTRIYATIAGFAQSFLANWSQIAYAQSQTRMTTINEGWVDIAAFDFFAGKLHRRIGESDEQLSLRIRAEVLRLRNTRAAVAQAVLDITSKPAVIFEAFNPGDTGGWDTYAFGYDVAGGWGDSEMTFQAFINTSNAFGGGIPQVTGWDGYAGGYDVGAIEWTDASLLVVGITDADIYQAIIDVQPAGTVMWVGMFSRGMGSNAALGTFILDINTLG